MEKSYIEKLYEAYYMQVYSYALTLTRDKPSAEDLTQTAFLRAMKTDSGCNGQAGELTWLCAIVKNLYRDEQRKNARQPQPLPLDESIASDGDSLEERISDQEDSFRIHTVLHTLEEPYKEVFTLRIFGELPYDHIGKLFGKSENWARVTYHRAKLKIQEVLAIDPKETKERKSDDRE